MATISSVLGPRKSGNLSAHPDIKHFLKGLALLNSPLVHRFLTCDLHLVLKALMGAPFEPLASVSVRFVTLKTIFLVAITSARQVSELGSPSVNLNLCVFHDDKVVLRLDPSFLPKVYSLFHRAQELILPTLCPKPNPSNECAWHYLDIKRVLSFYTDGTRDFRRSEALFLLFGCPSRSKKASVSSLSCWLRLAIVEAYKAVGNPVGVMAYSTRGAATSAVFDGAASLESICRVATWVSLNTFICHYRIELWA